jgi:argonaute-like protein implicated in RNA metabolism and viral defense
MPSQWERQLRKDVSNFLEREMKLQSKDKNLTLQSRLYDNSAHILKELKASKGHTLNIIGLPYGIPQTTYNRIKQLPEIDSQCFSQSTAENIYEPGFRRNLALAALIDAGVKPWILESELNYEVYVGIDILQNRAAFHFFWGPGARNILFTPGRSVSQARHQEAIKAPHVMKYLGDGLAYIYSQTKQAIKSVTIHRDGRWWQSEQNGLDKTVEKLRREGVIDPKCRVAVVEIRKTHLPVRIMMKKYDRGMPYFSNPIPGVYRVINKNQILMATTWFPVRPDSVNGRTSGVLLMNTVYSEPDHDIIGIGRDVYDLTQLNWTAPGIEINVPVTIRWADHRLREHLPKLEESEEDDLDLEVESEDDEVIA